MFLSVTKKPVKKSPAKSSGQKLMPAQTRNSINQPASYMFWLQKTATTSGTLYSFETIPGYDFHLEEIRVKMYANRGGAVIPRATITLKSAASARQPIPADGVDTQLIGNTYDETFGNPRIAVAMDQISSVHHFDILYANRDNIMVEATKTDGLDSDIGIALVGTLHPRMK